MYPAEAHPINAGHAARTPLGTASGDGASHSGSAQEFRRKLTLTTGKS
jgi:hypothetical protein